ARSSCFHSNKRPRGLRQSRNDHDLNEHPRSPKFGRETSTHRRVYRIDPLVPNRVVIFKQTHVSDPDLGAQQLLLVGSRELEKLIDASQHLSGLGLDIAHYRVGGDAGEIGDIAVNDCLADDRLTAILVCYLSNFVAYDRHDVSFLRIECLAGLTGFAAAAILNPIADTARISIENQSACAELFERDNDG